MNITEKQLLMLFAIVQSTLKVGLYEDFCYNIDTRLKLIDDIIEQQDNETFINFQKEDK